MERVFYEEKQKLAHGWSWFVVIAGLAVSFPFFRILYLQTVLDHQQSLSIKGAIITLCLVTLVVVVVTWLTAAYSLEVKIGNSGIYYQSSLTHQKMQHIEKGAIVSYLIREVELKDFFHSEHEWKRGKRKSLVVYSVRGSTVLEITLDDKRKILLGTTNKESLAWAMRKLIDSPA